MKKVTILSLFILSMQPCLSQDNSDSNTASALPYQNIPPYLMEYNPGNILSRFMDGLGYRYYWATEGLTTKDLDYKPSEEARNTRQTLEHILDMSVLILNAAKNEPNTQQAATSDIPLDKLREQTLNNFKQASEAYANKSADEISQLKVIFGSNEQRNEFPFWNMINGPISDAIYHTGQIVSFRRATGNPINPEVNVFLGKTGK